MRALFVSSLFLAATLSLGGCAATTADHGDDEGQSSDLAGALSAAALTTSDFFVDIEGSVQGKFKGEEAREEHQGKIPGISFHYTVKSPRDSASGMASGKRAQVTITWTKKPGAAT